VKNFLSVPFILAAVAFMLAMLFIAWPWAIHTMGGC
jgi:hypothetical protein